MFASHRETSQAVKDDSVTSRRGERRSERQPAWVRSARRASPRKTARPQVARRSQQVRSTRPAWWKVKQGARAAGRAAEGGWEAGRREEGQEKEEARPAPGLVSTFKAMGG